jgi:preprotein translocase subunit SecA
VEHEVLNAKQHEREANIVENAGRQHTDGHGKTVGNVTIATNMAGRGTDIKIVPDALKVGGLHVIGTERHTARRIDNQLRGRSGRQGDAGSSQFYVSLQDDLMKMFAGEWTIKVLGFLGMKEGEAIQDKRITKGILRAQKKVEERNFLSRKNLLEYDEVNDHHRSIFYGIRQKVLEGRDINEVIWDMIGQSVEDAVDRFITRDYVSEVIAEWGKSNFNINIEASDLRHRRHYDDLCDYFRVQAEAEADTRILTDLQEFTGEEGEDASQWDTKGISSWAMSRLGINLPQSQIRKLDLRQLQDWVKDAAIEQIHKRDCSGIQKYLEPLYAQKELAAWAKDKFQAEFDPKEFLEDSRSSESKPADQIVEMIEARARQSYAKRELEYPAESIIGFAFGENNGGTANPYAADFVRGWVRAKYNVDWTIESIQSKPVHALRDEMIALQRQFLAEGEFKKEVDRILLEGAGDEAKTMQLFQARFPAPPKFLIKGGVDASAELSLRDRLLERAHGFLRQELTDLEQFILIQILDQSWKDHLYALDMLKSSIGLQAFAEQDPRVLYKTEGYECFRLMMIGVRDKVTDLIFRARVVGQAEARNAYNVTGAVHQADAGYGVAENLAATADAERGSPSEMRFEADAAGGAQGAEQERPAVVQTIVRQGEKVGRNDPCPCGSGKKYKKCCGAGVAA